MAHPSDRRPHSVALEARKERAVRGTPEAAIDEISHAVGAIDGTLVEGYYGDDKAATRPPFLDDYSHYAAANEIHSAAAGHRIDDSPSPAAPAAIAAHNVAVQDSQAAISPLQAPGQNGHGATAAVANAFEQNRCPAQPPFADWAPWPPAVAANNRSQIDANCPPSGTMKDRRRHSGRRRRVLANVLTSIESRSNSRPLQRER